MQKKGVPGTVLGEEEEVEFFFEEGEEAALFFLEGEGLGGGGFVGVHEEEEGVDAQGVRDALDGGELGDVAVDFHQPDVAGGRVAGFGQFFLGDALFLADTFNVVYDKFIEVHNYIIIDIN